MTQQTARAIKNWIKKMGFKLDKSHLRDSRSRRINYYILDNFGVFEEISADKSVRETRKKQKFISWNPWGIDLEINSVRDLSKAYEDFLRYNPNVALR